MSLSLSLSISLSLSLLPGTNYPVHLLCVPKVHSIFCDQYATAVIISPWAHNVLMGRKTTILVIVSLVLYLLCSLCPLDPHLLSLSVTIVRCQYRLSVSVVNVSLSVVIVDCQCWLSVLVVSTGCQCWLSILNVGCHCQFSMLVVIVGYILGTERNTVLI